MKEFVEYVVKGLVDQPDQVIVTEIRRGGSITLELHVAADDMGRVIGKGGRVANSIRSLLRVMAARDGSRVTLEIM
jgi:predicted RNA-binding protein YlqC (UPF0109 family)